MLAHEVLVLLEVVTERSWLNISFNMPWMGNKSLGFVAAFLPSESYHPASKAPAPSSHPVAGWGSGLNEKQSYAGEYQHNWSVF